MALLIFLIALLLLTGYILLSAAILYWLEKLFNVPSATYQIALRIAVSFSLFWLFITILTNLVPVFFLELVVLFFFFYWLTNQYYQLPWKKIVGVFLGYVILSSLVLITILLPIRAYLVLPIVVVGDAMHPTYRHNDYLIFNRLVNNLSRGDAVAFRLEDRPEAILISRIVGLPGEQIEVRESNVYADGVLLEEISRDFTPGEALVTLGPEEYFVLGDNRVASIDSRDFGPIPRASIEARVTARIPRLR
jgi:signal peptidase I